MLNIFVLGALAETLSVNEARGYEIDNPIGIEGLGYVEDLCPFSVCLPASCSWASSGRVRPW
jgi:hypothetical protein